MNNNPLLQVSPYRNEVPAFDKVQTAHFLPALEIAVAEGKKEIEAIKNTKSPNFANIIEALENSGHKLELVASVFFHFDSANNTEELQQIALDFKTKLTAYESDVSLDKKLFEQVKAVYDSRNKYSLSPEQGILLEDTYKGFVRNGALLSEDKKQALRKNDEKQAELKDKYGLNILSATNEFELYISEESELEGLPEGFKTAAKEMAKENNHDDKWLITLHAPSVIPVLTYAANRSLREKIWRAYGTRCKSGKFDNRVILLEIVKLRDERAKLLGYKNHAEYVLEERMAKNTKNVTDMLEGYYKKVKPVALKEFDELQAFAISTGFSEKLKPWDISYYAEKMKASIYGFDGEHLRPYFKFENVREGAFNVAARLYNISFKKADDYPLYHNEVETFDVIDNKTGELVGILYTDYFPRKTKQGGAWMNDYVKQSTLEGKRKPPVIGNHGNFTKPTKDKPSLLNIDEVLTFFHEFGHGLHGLLSNTRYKSQAGTSVKWDFVELPSQIMENWVKEKDVLNLFAKHFETGEFIPAELIEKMRAADNFRAASGFLRQVMLATLDIKWHTANPQEIKTVEDFEYAACKDFYILQPEGSLISPSFSHIFDGGYSAGYYSYKWAEILDADAFEAFKESGLFNVETAAKFRTMLSKGGSADPEALYIAFRGRKPDPEALLRREGLAA